MKINIEGLSPDEAFVVKWQYRLLGDFEAALAICLTRADHKNFDRLEVAFPTQAGGYWRYVNTPGWWDEVEKKAGIKD